MEINKKAEMFDWLCSHLQDGKLRLSFGGTDNIYPECNANNLIYIIEDYMEYEKDNGKY